MERAMAKRQPLRDWLAFVDLEVSAQTITVFVAQRTLSV